MILAYKHRIYLLALLATILFWVRKVFSLVIWKGNVAPRPGDSSVSTQWVQSIIRENGYPNVVVKSVKIGDLDNNRGLAAQINKIEVVYAQDPSSIPTLPTKFILKTTPGGFAGRAGVIGQGAWREAIFYKSGAVSKLIPSTSSGGDAKVETVLSSRAKGQNLSGKYMENIPRIWYAHGSCWFGECVVLQSDVSVMKDAAPLNFVFGNQIWGIPKPVNPPRDIVDTLRTVFATTAKHHARHWNDITLLHLPWLKAAGWYAGQDRDSWEHAMQNAQAHWRHAKAKASAPGSGITFNEQLVSLIEKSFKESSWETMQAHLKDHKQNPFTLTHGDYHASNMFLYRDENSTADKPIWFDWSEVGLWEPMTDLGQMLISDIPRAITKEHSKELVRAYWNTLISSGVSEAEYPWKNCWNAFCRGGAERWCWIFCFLADFPLPPTAIQYFHDQLLGFIQDHCPTETHFHFKTLVALL